MPHGFFGYCVPVGGRPVDPDYGIPDYGGGGTVTPPIHLPPSIYPPPTPPGIDLPPGFWAGHFPGGPGTVTPPIALPAPPDLPPGTVWPPLDPSAGLNGKYLAVAGIAGVGWRWVVIDTNLSVGTPLPPSAQPKR